MSVVVERGSARCPHCVAVADYTFVESELDTVLYEVDCRSCGEVYSEVNSLAPAVPVERILPLPPLPTAAHESWRRHLAPLGRIAGRLRDRGIEFRRLARVGTASKTPTSGEYGANG